MKFPKTKEISSELLKKILSIILAVFAVVVFFTAFEIYMPVNPDSHQIVSFIVEKGWGDDQIAVKLKEAGLIRSPKFFQFYVISTLRHTSLQAGEYNLSPKESTYEIAKKMAQGDIVRDKVIILEGWDINHIGKYLESKEICTKEDFFELTKKDYSEDFDFLADKPKVVTLEGYLFPDTYEISKSETCEDILYAMLNNFGKKITSDLREEISRQGESIYNIVTMASLIEKEVRTLQDKEIVSGILWKRLEIGMPLQVDATLIYITGRTSVLPGDKKIDSPYNTYMYYGLPAGPISNPGLNSITAVIYPRQTNYLFYLSDGTTIFSKTLAEHNAAIEKYLKY